MVHFATCVPAGRVDESRDVGKRARRPGGRGRNDHTSRNFDHRGRCDGSFCDLCACRPAMGFGPITGVGKIAGMVNPVGGCNGRPAKSIPGIGEPGSPIFAGAPSARLPWLTGMGIPDLSRLPGTGMRAAPWSPGVWALALPWAAALFSGGGFFAVGGV